MNKEIWVTAFIVFGLTVSVLTDPAFSEEAGDGISMLEEEYAIDQSEWEDMGDMTAPDMNAPDMISDQQQAQEDATVVQKALTEKWWIPEKPYDLWTEEQLLKWVSALEEFREELVATSANPATIRSVEEQITAAKRILSRIF